MKTEEFETLIINAKKRKHRFLISFDEHEYKEKLEFIRLLEKHNLAFVIKTIPLTKYIQTYSVLVYGEIVKPFTVDPYEFFKTNIDCLNETYDAIYECPVDPDFNEVHYVRAYSVDEKGYKR